MARPEAGELVPLDREALRRYFARTVEGEPEETREASLAWRLSTFDAGLDFADYIEREHFPLVGRRALDAASGWGGHACALATRGAEVIGADLNDHAFAELDRFTREQQLDVTLVVSNCERLAFRDGTFDVIFALELIEHIDSVERFAAEVSRLLKPGGVCLLSTPARFRSLIEGEPHYQLRGLTILPFPWQRVVATRLFKREYPFPIPRQYARSTAVLRPFEERGLEGRTVVRGRMASRLESVPAARRALEEFYWTFFVLRKA